MVDDIPVAHRQSSAYLTAPSAAGMNSWKWVLMILSLVIGLGISLLLAWRPSPLPSEPLTQADPALVATSASTASVVKTVRQVQPNSTPDTRPSSVLGHFPFTEAPTEDLDSVGTYQGRPTLLRRAAAQQYREMATAAHQSGITLVPISGFRSQADQEYLFFQRARDRAQRPSERAEVSAPPGYSEHHTGYAVDIGDVSAPQADLQVSFEQTPAFHWLQANAPRYGFELSFPPDNSQGVSYEPWHWRFVGDRHSLETFYAQSDTSP